MTSPIPASAVFAVTGPRLAHNSDTRCGARSQSAPFSLRHGVLNGLASVRAEPSQTATPPVHWCWATDASQARTSAWNRAVKNTTDATPASWTASASASAAASLVAIGFFQQQMPPSGGRPDRQARLNVSGRTANATASTSDSNASKLSNQAQL